MSSYRGEQVISITVPVIAIGDTKYGFVSAREIPNYTVSLDNIKTINIQVDKILRRFKYMLPNWKESLDLSGYFDPVAMVIMLKMTVKTRVISKVSIFNQIFGTPFRDILVKNSDNVFIVAQPMTAVFDKIIPNTVRKCELKQIICPSKYDELCNLFEVELNKLDPNTYMIDILDGVMYIGMTNPPECHIDHIKLAQSIANRESKNPECVLYSKFDDKSNDVVPYCWTMESDIKTEYDNPILSCWSLDHTNQKCHETLVKITSFI